MSISTGKLGYDSRAYWKERTLEALRNNKALLYEYDTGAKDDDTVRVIKKQLSLLPPAPAILEIGSGFGKWARVLRGMYSEFVGAEVIEERVEFARKNNEWPGVSFYQIFHDDWHIKRKFDVVMSITVIQHLTLPQGIEVLKAIDRHLAPTGTAILCEGRIWEITMEEAEEKYKEAGNSFHMIPKPIKVLMDAVPTLNWIKRDGTLYLLRKKNAAE